MRMALAGIILIIGFVGICRSPAYVNSGGPACVKCRQPATFLADKPAEWLRDNRTDRYCSSCYWQHARAAGMADEVVLLIDP